MSFSQPTLINRVRLQLGVDDWHDVCTEAMDTTETGLDVADTTLWAVGDVLQFEDDGELCFVSALASGTTLTVVRNYLFSVTTTALTGTSHSSSADITKNPVFTIKQMKEAVEEVLRGLWPHVYTKVTADLTPVASGLYSVAATVEDISSAMQRDTDSNGRPRFYGGRRSYHPIDLIQNLPDNFPTTEDTGKAVYIPRAYNQTNTIRLNGIRRLTAATTAGPPVTYDDLTEGVEVDCVADLATAELLERSDARRSTGEDVSMNDQSVSPGRRSALGETIWRVRGMRARHQWERSLRLSLPRMERFGGRS
jgi:hypothetical protein